VRGRKDNLAYTGLHFRPVNEKNMYKLRIKTESLPIRCDICHKADCYEPDFDFCSRCNELLDEAALNAIENMQGEEEFPNYQIVTINQIQKLIITDLFQVNINS
jgi:hypothetical protein